MFFLCLGIDIPIFALMYIFSNIRLHNHVLSFYFLALIILWFFDLLPDKVFCLPEDWPWIKQLSRPMSCMLTTSRLPCVKKAVSHLELIQNVIDDWFKNREDMVGSQFSKKESPTSASALCE